MPLNDLISEGNLGLIKAVYRFDKTKGFKFISFSVFWIRRDILQAIAEKLRIIKLPLNQIPSISGINKTYFRLEQELEREPSVE